MAPMFTPVSAIAAGRIKIKLNIRVIRLWTVYDYNKPNDESFVHMLLMDDKVCDFILWTLNLFVVYGSNNKLYI